MKLFLLTPLLATALATPAPAATSCAVGQVYCGWYLINQLGWSSSDLRTKLCSTLGKCDFNNGDAWNSLWHCTGSNSVVPSALCGGEGSCKGPTAHCG
ncbi:hypothetical protein BU23DRAFT_550218 [Bimuria novae-zelandiae CBS 107.79]|uniref:Extracellular membrane protein CFEM domain-containing protein n=1 Tax=Bimuria novae-zelandiae CBS 107.79 TaxID=1447943 RepID=A0A6A5VNN8_9PLEO|nr:hypothetical protein BU23DRAFT_550218 [Bimuria novae-zelandiae CBS 107.79]